MAWAVRRTAVFLGSLVLASILVFAVMAVLPGDPAQVAAGTEATPEQVEALREQYGLDGPAVERYVDWIGGLLSGDLGLTFIGQRSIADEIGTRLPVTIPLVVLSTLLALAIAAPLGLLAAVHHRRPLGTGISALSQVGIAIPAFWAGLMLSSLVAVRWGLLPAGGFVPWEESAREALRHLLLPAISLALVQAAILTRYIRSSTLEVLGEDYMRTARAKGHTRTGALRRHGTRNIAIPVITILALQFTGALVGAVVIENVFALPGLGKLLIDAVGNREIILVMDIVMLLTFITLLVGLLVDALYVVIDPRLRGATR